MHGNMGAVASLFLPGLKQSTIAEFSSDGYMPN